MTEQAVEVGEKLGVANARPECADLPGRSGVLSRPIDGIRRPAVCPDDARTELERYKASLRKYSPVNKGRDGLPWKCRSHCIQCDEVVASQFVYDQTEDAMYLEFECPNCGTRRERHADALFVQSRPRAHPCQPERTYGGSVIHPVVNKLPRTVETLCPECSCIILGRYYVKDNVVLIEKTCPEHGYFRDKINTDAELYLRHARGVFQDERGVYEPQVKGGEACPSDCGLCNQHISTSCLAQIDLTNRCNLTCPVCFASANQAGYVAEPSFEMVVEMLRALRNQQPHPATAIQFTGGEPTVHPEFHRIIRKTTEMGFSHIQIATNGIALANMEFAERAAEAGLHTLYLQFDGLDDALYRRMRAEPLLEKKLACIENCHKLDVKICLVPTIVKRLNDDQVGKILRFALQNAEVISGIAYQPVSFTGRISHRQRAEQRYTLGDLAHDIAEASGADVHRDFFPLSVVAPLPRIMQLLDGKPKIRPSCHSDCAFGTYFFVTPEHEAIPIPALFDLERLFGRFNELAHRIGAKRKLANRWDRLRIFGEFMKSYRWRNYDPRVGPMTFIRAIQGMTNKRYGRGDNEKKCYKTLMAAGMHFMDRYNYDMERIRRCVIQYSTPDGIYPFCTINGGPTYRPFIEAMHGRSEEKWEAEHPDVPMRPSSHPNAMMPWAGRFGIQEDESEPWMGDGVTYEKLRRILEDDQGNGSDGRGCST